MSQVFVFRHSCGSFLALGKGKVNVILSAGPESTEYHETKQYKIGLYTMKSPDQQKEISPVLVTVVRVNIILHSFQYIFNNI